MKKNLIGFIFIAMIILIGFVFADQNCDDNYPSMNLYEYYGKVYYKNAIFAEQGFEVIAQINEEQVGHGEINENGDYVIEVTKCSTITSGQIEFFVGDAYATNSEDWEDYEIPEGIISKELDLSLNKYPNASCGNGIIDGADECDDGNTNSKDGCSNVCEVEYGYSCKSAPSICELIPNAENNEDSSSSSSSSGSGSSSSGSGDSKDNFVELSEDNEKENLETEEIDLSNLETEKETKEERSSNQYVVLIFAIIGILLILGVIQLIKPSKTPKDEN